MQDMNNDWQAWYDARRKQIDDAITKHLQAVQSPHSRLAEAVRYSATGGGKRLRPVLVLESCRVCGGADARAMPAALAIEFVHAFSLVHDDLPAMDDDDLRRGQPACHKVYGDATAILAGDWLLTAAFRALTAMQTPHEQMSAMVQALADGTTGMIIGQSADIECEGLDPSAERVEFIHEHKTARLFEAACKLGALCAAPDERAVSDMAEYGRQLGLAFQIADDLLDLTSQAEVLGKGVRKDANKDKQTYADLLGADASRGRAREHVSRALARLERFGDPAANLRILAEYAVERVR